MAAVKRVWFWKESIIRRHLFSDVQTDKLLKQLLQCWYVKENRKQVLHAYFIPSPFCVTSKRVTVITA